MNRKQRRTQAAKLRQAKRRTARRDARLVLAESAVMASRHAPFLYDDVARMARSVIKGWGGKR